MEKSEQSQFGTRELPKYNCHKQVWALKIAKLDGNQITPAEEEFAPFSVSPSYITKHNPQVGGYYVLYKDGYCSFSPAAAFEEGYTLAEGVKIVP